MEDDISQSTAQTEEHIPPPSLKKEVLEDVDSLFSLDKVGTDKFK